MYLDYEEFRLYFSEEDLKNINPTKEIYIFSFKHDQFWKGLISNQNFCKKNYIDISRTFIKIEQKLNYKDSFIEVESVYYTDDKKFICSVLGDKITEISLQEIDYKVEILLPEKIKNIRSTNILEGLLIDIPNSCNYILSIYELINTAIHLALTIGTCYRRDLHNSVMPLKLIREYYYRGFTLSHALQEELVLKDDPLYVGYFFDGTTNIMNYLDIKLLSIHKYRKYIITKDKKLLTNISDNPRKHLCKMFLNPESILKKIELANDYKNNLILEEVKGLDIVHWYNMNNYLESKGDLGQSCMKYPERSTVVSFYAQQENCSLLILRVKDKLLARALIWNTDKGRVMDRIYFTFPSEINQFKEYAKNNNIDFIYDYRKPNTTCPSGFSPSNWSKLYYKHYTINLTTIDVNELDGCGQYITHTHKYIPYIDNFNYIDIHNKVLTNFDKFFENPLYEISVHNERYYHLSELVKLRGNLYCKKEEAVLGYNDEWLYSPFRLNGIDYHQEDVVAAYDYSDRFVYVDVYIYDCVYDSYKNVYLVNNPLTIEKYKIQYKNAILQNIEKTNENTKITEEITQEINEILPF